MSENDEKSNEQRNYFKEVIEGLKIVLFGFVAALTMGIIKDLILVWLSFEYFQETFSGLARKYNLANNTMLFIGRHRILLGTACGIIYAWRDALIFCIFLALSARFWRHKQLTNRNLYKPTVFTMMCVLIFTIWYGFYYSGTTFVHVLDISDDLKEDLANYYGVPRSKTIDWTLDVCENYLLVVEMNRKFFTLDISGGFFLICFILYIRFFKNRNS